MAQAKTARSTSKRSSGQRSPNGSRAKTGSGRSGSSKSRASGNARSRKPRASAQTSSARSRARQDTGSLARVAQRAKGPAIAGGAALVGLAGGLALNNGKRRSGLARARPNLNLSMPKPKGSTVKILGGAAKEIAKGSYKIGQLTSEVQKVRKAVESQDSRG